MRRRVRQDDHVAALAAELAEQRAAIVVITEAVTQAAAGDLEARVPSLGDQSDLETLRGGVNRLLDVADAFVRESQAALTAAADGRYHRRFLTQGMPGTFRGAATQIDASRAAMEQSAAELAEQVAARATFAEAAIASSTQVTADLGEVAVSTAGLAASTAAAVTQARAALETMRQLEQSSAATSEAVTLISRVAGETRMLALNATIEAARAGDAGRGFAVVAHEVRSLADETARSATSIGEQMAEAIAAATEAAQAIDRIAALIDETDEQVGVISAATGEGSNLSGMTRTLRAQIGTFAG